MFDSVKTVVENEAHAYSTGLPSSKHFGTDSTLTLGALVALPLPLAVFEAAKGQRGTNMISVVVSVLVNVSTT